MNIGFVGLGKMGGNMVRRLISSNISVISHDHDADQMMQLASEYETRTAASLEALVAELDSPRVIWLMLPAGIVTETAISRLQSLLTPGDIVVDGANSNYRDSVRRGQVLAGADIGFLDAGVSGGVWGRQNGYGLMVGGAKQTFAHVQPIIEQLAPSPEKGWLHTGPVGSGHFCKMVHNGIEYGLMQAYAEGFALLEAKNEFELDVAAVSQSWRHGSVIRSWLLDLTSDVLAKNPSLDDIAPIVEDSGEGRWAAIESIELGVPAPVLNISLQSRMTSRGQSGYANKLIASMRDQFGGHGVQSTNRKD